MNLLTAQRAELTYPEVGATRAAAMPAGYTEVRLERQLGTGRPAFDAATAGLFEWQVHRRSGIRVMADGPASRVGATVLLRLGPPWLPGIVAPCRVVYVIDEPARAGFGYGTLAGHPECGEEAFLVRLEPDGTVIATVSAFSRPASALARLGGPVTRRAQRWMAQRYVDALRELAG